MKLRNGFVSNSSSSSFVIKKSDLFEGEEQIRLIKEHIEVNAELFKISSMLGQEGICEYDKWDIVETDDAIEGHTILDNFNMEQYLNRIADVNYDDIEWEE